MYIFRKIALVAERPEALNRVRPEHLVITTWGGAYLMGPSFPNLPSLNYFNGLGH
jgi:hypothetical protein